MKQGARDETRTDEYLFFGKDGPRDVVALYGERACPDIQGERKDGSEVGRLRGWNRWEVTTRWKRMRYTFFYKTDFGRRLRGIKDLSDGYGVTTALKVIFSAFGIYCWVLLLNLFV